MEYEKLDQDLRQLRMDFIMDHLSCIYNVVNDELSDEWKAIMAEVCKHYHIVNIELKDIEKQNRHPNRKGMRQIVEQLAEELK